MDDDLLSRRMILHIEPDTLLALLRGDRHLTITPPLPPDMQVLSVQNDWASTSCQFLIVSRAFPPCDRGAIPPAYPGNQAWPVITVDPCPCKEKPVEVIGATLQRWVHDSQRRYE